MCNLHITKTEISQKRSKGIKNWKITYSVILSVLSNKTNLILDFRVELVSCLLVELSFSCLFFLFPFSDFAIIVYCMMASSVTIIHQNWTNQSKWRKDEDVVPLLFEPGLQCCITGTIPSCNEGGGLYMQFM